MIIRADNLKTSGAKIFSNLAGAPTDGPLLDNQPDLWRIQKAQKAPYGPLQEVSNRTDLAEVRIQSH